MPSLTTFEEAEKELELRNWATMYQTTNNSLGPALLGVQARAKGDAEKAVRTHAMERPQPPGKVDEYLRKFRRARRHLFLTLKRTLLGERSAAIEAAK